MYQYTAKLIRVIDGDTVVLDLDLGFNEWRVGQHYRLLRINAPELNDPTGAGTVAKTALEQFLLGKSLIAMTQKSDSFGRWLVELYADGANASDWMVADGSAKYAVYR